MIEKVARDSAGELRAETTSDVEAGLADLYVRQSRRRRRSAMGAAAALVGAVAVGWTAGAVVTQQDDAATPPSQVTHRSDHAHDPACRARLVDCLGGRTFRFALTRPVVWHVPRGFGVNSGGGVTSLNVESYRTAGPLSGVSVAERVRASSPDGVGAARGIADDPQAFVRWVANRPFLSSSRVVQTQVDGHPAWQVRVTLAPGAPPGNARCNGYDCHLVMYQPGGGTAGIWDTMAAQYTAFRLPGAGTTVVWSWTFSGETRDLNGLDASLNGLSWPTG